MAFIINHKSFFWLIGDIFYSLFIMYFIIGILAIYNFPMASQLLIVGLYIYWIPFSICAAFDFYFQESFGRLKIFHYILWYNKLYHNEIAWREGYKLIWK